MTTISSIGAGAPNLSQIGAASVGGWNGNIIDLPYGGSNANLNATLSNGGIVYSTASALAILAGTATALKPLFSGSSVAPFWSTSTWPNSCSVNSLLYCTTSANAIGVLAKTNGGVLTTNGSGVPQWTPGQSGSFTVGVGGTAKTSYTAYSVICSGTTATGVWANVVGVGSASQVLTSAGAAAYPVWANPTLGIAVNVASSTVTLAIGNNYIINDGATLVTLTLPTTANPGDSFSIRGQASGGWIIAQNASQIIYGAISSTHTTAGITGTLASANQYNSVTIVCVVANTTFIAMEPKNSTLTYV